MKNESKIAELGMINMLTQIKNPITNIRLCLELLESDTVAKNQKVYYGIMRASTRAIELSIRDICNSFHDLGITIHVGTDITNLEKKSGD